MNKSTWANTSAKSGQNCGKEGCKWLKWNNFSNPSLPVLEKKLHPRLSEAPNQQEIPYTHVSRNEKGSSPCHAPNAHTCARSFGDLRQPLQESCKMMGPRQRLSQEDISPLCNRCIALAHWENRGSEVVASGKASLAFSSNVHTGRLGS